MWIKALETKGRIPFILIPVLCEVCGEKWPNFFRVPDEEWQRYIPPDKRRLVICPNCYTGIKAKVDRGEPVEYPKVCARCGTVNPRIKSGAEIPEWTKYIGIPGENRTFCSDCQHYIE